MKASTTTATQPSPQGEGSPLNWQRGLTFEKVWAALMEDREARKEEREARKKDMEARKEDREVRKEDKEAREKFDRDIQRIKKIQKETALQMKETDRILGKFGNRIGEIIEEMVKPNLLEKFRKLGFTFTKIYKHAELRDENNDFLTEIDFTLEDGDKVMLVEVKSKPNIENIIEHLERMEKVRVYADKRYDKRKYLGAVAGMVINDNVKIFALKNGFYVIEPSGDTFNIIVPEGSFAPREWI